MLPCRYHVNLHVAQAASPGAGLPLQENAYDKAYERVQ